MCNINTSGRIYPTHVSLTPKIPFTQIYIISYHIRKVASSSYTHTRRINRLYAHVVQLLWYLHKFWLCACVKDVPHEWKPIDCLTASLDVCVRFGVVENRSSAACLYMQIREGRNKLSVAKWLKTVRARCCSRVKICAFRVSYSGLKIGYSIIFFYNLCLDESTLNGHTFSFVLK